MAARRGGVAPKDPDKRVRRNAVETVELPAKGFRGKAPALPRTYQQRHWDQDARGYVETKVAFLAESKQWYATWRSSPQANRFTSTDWQHLRMLTVLVDRFWRGDHSVLSELRLNGANIGQTAGDRQRLHWRVVDQPGKAVPAGEDPTEAKRARAGSRQRKDPRLRVVS